MNTTLVKTLAHNGVVLRAVALAVAAVAALAVHKPFLVPFAVTLYAVANAAALTKAALKTERARH